MTNSFVTIKQASIILGVSPLTLRNWDKNGRLKALRHPMNNYRVYRVEDLEKVIQEMEAGTRFRKDKREFKKVTIRHLTD